MTPAPKLENPIISRGCLSQCRSLELNLCGGNAGGGDWILIHASLSKLQTLTVNTNRVAAIDPTTALRWAESLRGGAPSVLIT